MKAFKISLISTNGAHSEKGLRTISSYLKKHGFQTQLIFLPTFAHIYSIKIIKNLKDLIKDSDLVGISCMNLYAKNAIQIIASIKSLKIPIVWGGIYATLDSENCLKHVDIVCRGEGEEAMLELARAIRDKKDFTKIQNLWVKRDGKIIRNGVRPLIQDLDKLPQPDYDLKHQYILVNNKIVSMSNKYFSSGEFNRTSEYLNRYSKFILVHTTRGCPFSCKFCYNYDLKKLYANKGTYLRKRSLKNVINELEKFKQKISSLEYIWFTDDDFFIHSVEELRFFSKEYKIKIGLPFFCYVNPMTLNEEKLKLFIDAGLIRLGMGLQTGSERVNKFLFNRVTTNKQMIDAARILNKYTDKIEMVEYHIIGSNPYENVEDVLETIKLIKKLPKPFYLKVYNMVFPCGSQCYHDAMQDGTIKSEKDTFSELDYRETIKHLKSKKRIQYVSTILNLMHGTCTNFRCGVIPKFALEILTHKRVIQFNKKFKFIGYLLLFLPRRETIFYMLPPDLKRLHLKLGIIKNKIIRSVDLFHKNIS